MGADEVRHEILLLAGGFAGLFKLGLERLEGIVMRFLHHVQYVRADVFGGDLEVAADEVLGQEPDVVLALQGQIVPDAGGDEDVRFFLLCVSPLEDAIQHGDDGVVGRQFRTRRRKQAAHAFTGWGGGTGHAVHVGGRAADVLDGAAELRMLRDAVQFVNDRFRRAGCDLLALVEVDGAKTAPAETAAMRGDAELHGLERGDAAEGVVFWVPHARKRQRIQRVEILLAQWRSRGVDNDLSGALILGDRPAGGAGLVLVGQLEIHEFCVVGL